MEQIPSSTECVNKTLRVALTEKIRPNPKQPRKYFDPNKIELLGQSIVEIGQKDPITVRPVPNTDTYEIIDGERRYRACVLKDIKTMDVIIEFDVTEENVHIGSLILNFHQEFHTHKEVFHALHKEHISGMSLDDLALALGRSKTWVYFYLSLSKLAPELQTIIEHDTKEDCLRFTDAIKLAQLDDHEAQVRIFENVRDLPPNRRKARLKKLVDSEKKPVKQRNGRNFSKKTEIRRSKKSLYSFIDRVSAGVETVLDLPNSTFQEIVKGMIPDEKELMRKELEECVDNLTMLKDLLQ